MAVSSPTFSSVFVESYNFVFEMINMEDSSRHISTKSTRFCLHTPGILRSTTTRAYTANQLLKIKTCNMAHKCVLFHVCNYCFQGAKIPDSLKITGTLFVWHGPAIITMICSHQRVPLSASVERHTSPPGGGDNSTLL